MRQWKGDDMDTRRTETVDDSNSGPKVDLDRRATLVRTLKAAAYVAPITLTALTIQAHATSADG